MRYAVSVVNEIKFSGHSKFRRSILCHNFPMRSG
jgi:hypothetical protein